MAAGLFDTPESSASGDLPPIDDGYRAFGGVTIAATVLALLSPLGFIDWWLLTVPLLAVVLGLVGWRDILARPDVLAGKVLAIGSMSTPANCHRDSSASTTRPCSPGKGSRRT